MTDTEEEVWKCYARFCKQAVLPEVAASLALAVQVRELNHLLEMIPASLQSLESSLDTIEQRGRRE